MARLNPFVNQVFSVPKGGAGIMALAGKSQSLRESGLFRLLLFLARVYVEFFHVSIPSWIRSFPSQGLY